MFLVVSYDISDNKRRLKVAKKLLDFGQRVQYSVFECHLTSQQLEKMRQQLLKIIDTECDTLRIYQLCEHCQPKIAVYGTGKIVEDVDLYII